MRIETVEILSGDIAVLSTDVFLTKEQANLIKAKAEADLGCKVVLFSGGLKLSIVRAA